MPASTATVAKVLARQIPLGQLSSILSHMPAHGGTAMGDGCGGGCGGGAGCLDPNGITGLTNHEIQGALRDTAGLKTALKNELQSHLGNL